jgi:VanZ family protein
VQPLRYPYRWLGVGIAALLVILLLALAPLSGDMPFRWSDKVAHFVVFAGLTVWFLGIFLPAVAPRVALALAAYGVLIEVAQGLTPYRAVELLDVVSDVAGIAAGWLLATAGLHRWCGRVEAWLGVDPR